ncbi:MAG: PduO protein [Desulfovibrio sp. MES5]|uniref:GlcG/HbpS family heme-binding protein n=1 Tax=Desulfovibrio sp. MES5 TaxID=1899016 RepID=UPI000B9D4A4E|nr:heme-binding protein [Desulfovibrio sp. MES5]OXS29230.1 MAG: PduO protein [Desulfovibrio sp. MES5]
MRTFIFTLVFMLTLGLSAVQAAPVKTHLPGDLTLEEAQDILKAALSKAKEVGVLMNIAVVDAGGNLKIFARQDGAYLGSIDIAQKKAKTARYFNMSTAELGAAAQPGKELFGIEVTNNGLAIFGGGELLVRGGVVVGAIGVSGGSVVDDSTVAKAGAAALQQSSKKSSF